MGGPCGPWNGRVWTENGRRRASQAVAYFVFITVNNRLTCWRRYRIHHAWDACERLWGHLWIATTTDAGQKYNLKLSNVGNTTYDIELSSRGHLQYLPKQSVGFQSTLKRAPGHTGAPRWDGGHEPSTRRTDVRVGCGW